MKKLFSDRSAWWSLFLEVVRVTVPLQFLLNILAWTMSTSNPTFVPLSCPKPQTCLPWCDIHTAATSPPTPFSPLPAISPSPPHPSSSSSSSYSSRFSSFSSAAAAMCVLRWVHACTQEQKEKNFQCHCPPLFTLLLENQLAISVRCLTSKSRNPLSSHSTDIRGSHITSGLCYVGVKDWSEITQELLIQIMHRRDGNSMEQSTVVLYLLPKKQCRESSRNLYFLCSWQFKINMGKYE